MNIPITTTPIINDMADMFRSFAQTSFKGRYPSIIIINPYLHPKLIIERNDTITPPLILLEDDYLKFAGVKIIRSADIGYIEMY